ncbi:NupC/NupG family nucleoside CNT transporter [Shouchella lehensis]|uniref:Nucleoside permease n=2 Tax=Shouchella lehensis TaxID=300825 RepID=A0A060LRY5_9BACI|nr:NupC/NupG family nucleoside CNT transporter [Shouchella lehensis]AIC92785.1 nucleoside transporter [Shouchella lehensis G1]MBG9783391.1 transporter [Shouchella lehensis]RQW22404.1 NupC/NupG family nucleoside CNT transporter [Bacillus sp. C1-1]TES49222.1 NupC/NupG family nucleoside CNT transporter [Shouchella lehensis]
MNVLWGIMGIVILLAFAFLLSTNKKAINWRTVLTALALQIVFAFIVLWTDIGSYVLEQVTRGVQAAIDTSGAGIDMLFGGIFAVEGVGMIFAFQVLPVIIFFSAVISVLYHYGIMQFIVRYLGGGISRLLQTSRAESVSATGNIFVGQTEAPLMIKPYLNKMTASELFAVMTGGMATVAGSVMAGISLMGIPLEYLIAATFMAAPGGLLMAKMIVPETEVSETKDTINLKVKSESRNFIDAASNGALDGLKLALNVGAMLIAFVSLIALINLLLSFVGNDIFGIGVITLEEILGFVFAPVAWIIGVPWGEALQAGSFIGQKTIVNEFIGFEALTSAAGDLSERTFIITSFALCGFANISSIAILLGGLGGMIPERRPLIAKYGVKALIAATLVNLMNATIAGMLIGG